MKDNRLTSIDRAMNVIALLTVLVSLFFNSFLLTLSIVLGFIFMKVNFWLLKIVASSLFRPSETEIKKGRLMALLITKYLGLVLAGAVLLYYFDLHAVGLLIGMTTLVAAIGIAAMREVFLS